MSLFCVFSVSCVRIIGTPPSEEEGTSSSGGDQTSGFVSTGSTGTTNDPTNAADSASTGMLPDPASTTADTESTEETDESGFSFLGTGGDGGALCSFTSLCSVWSQDCPRDEKCIPWACGGGDAWDLWRCSPIDSEPAAVGQSCTTQNSIASGVDSCGGESMCWDVDPDTLEGECAAFCTGTPQDPICPVSQTCMIANDAWLPVCVDDCQPLTADCGEDRGCYPTGEGQFGCLRTGAPIEVSGLFHTECPAGSFARPECGEDGSDCCAEYCDLDAVDGACAEGESCVPYFGELETPPPALENLGYCAGA